MLEKFKKLLHKPHPVGFNLVQATVLGGLVFFLLFALSPFGFEQFDIGTRFLKSLLFGGLTTLSSLFNFFLFEKVFGRFFSKTWRIAEELLYSLYDLLLIGLFNALVVWLLDFPDAAFVAVLLEMELDTFLIGSIPTLIFIIFQQHQFIKKELEQTREDKQNLHNQLQSQETQAQALTLCAENGKPSLQLLPSEILFIKSEGNYVEVFVHQDGATSKHLLRNRLKNVLQVLPHTQFFQCHRSYLINLSKVVKLSRNQREFALSLRASSQRIPVSRSKTDALLKLLDNELVS